MGISWAFPIALTTTIVYHIPMLNAIGVVKKSKNISHGHFRQKSCGFIDIVYLFLVLGYAKQHFGNAPCAISLWLRQRTNHLVLVPCYKVKGLVAFLKVLAEVMVFRERSLASCPTAIFPLRFCWKVKVDSTIYSRTPHLPFVSL